MANWDIPDRYLSLLNSTTREQVADFYFPNPGSTNRGIPSFSGLGLNAYRDINPNAYEGMDAEDNPGDKLYADLIRAQTKDYQQRFAPVENFLAKELTPKGTKSLGGDLARTQASITGAHENVQGMQRRAVQGMGLNYTPSSGSQQSMVGAIVGGLNDTRLRDQDRRQSLLTGSLSGISQKARGAAR